MNSDHSHDSRNDSKQTPQNGSDTSVSVLLEQVQAGDRASVDRLTAILMDELRRSALNLMRKERADHTLQPTALINEAVLRLLKSSALLQANNRRYLFGIANRAMKQVLIDHARKKQVRQFGEHSEREPLDLVIQNLEAESQVDLLQLETALEQLGENNPRQREVVECRFFGGMTIEETAEHLQVSVGTVERDWRLARAKLYRELS